MADQDTRERPEFEKWAATQAFDLTKAKSHDGFRKSSTVYAEIGFKAGYDAALRTAASEAESEETEYDLPNAVSRLGADKARKIKARILALLER